MSSVALREQTEPSRRGCLRLTDFGCFRSTLKRGAPTALLFFESVVRGVQSEPLCFANLPSFDYRPSELDFVVLPGHVFGDAPDQRASYNRTTLESAIFSAEPGADSSPIESASSDGLRRAAITLDDSAIDSRPATQVLDDDIVIDQELPSIPPMSSRRPVIANCAQPQPSAAPSLT